MSTPNRQPNTRAPPAIVRRPREEGQNSELRDPLVLGPRDPYSIIGANGIIRTPQKPPKRSRKNRKSRKSRKLRKA